MIKATSFGNGAREGHTGQRRLMRDPPEERNAMGVMKDGALSETVNSSGFIATPPAVLAGVKDPGAELKAEALHEGVRTLGPRERTAASARASRLASCNGVVTRSNGDCTQGARQGAATADSRWYWVMGRRQRTADVRQRTADSRQQTADSRQQAAKANQVY